MLIIIILIVLTIIGCTIVHRDTDYSSTGFWGGMLAFVCGVSLLCMFISTPFVIADNKVAIDYYNQFTIVLEENRDKGLLENAFILSEINEINKNILTHRRRANSPWVGIWYSEEIGNLELLK